MVHFFEGLEGEMLSREATRLQIKSENPKRYL